VSILLTHQGRHYDHCLRDGINRPMVWTCTDHLLKTSRQSLLRVFATNVTDYKTCLCHQCYGLQDSSLPPMLRTTRLLHFITNFSQGPAASFFNRKQVPPRLDGVIITQKNIFLRVTSTENLIPTKGTMFLPAHCNCSVPS
jgi:hypothetical protein